MFIGAGVLAATIGVVIVVLALSGGDANDLASSPTDVSTIGPSDVSTIGPSGVASSAPSTETTTETTLEESVIPAGAIIGYDLELQLTSFEELPWIFRQQDLFPDSLELEVVCGPTKCLVPAVNVVNPFLFDVGAPTVSFEGERVARRGDGDFVCTFVSDEAHELTLQADGSYIGTMSTTARHLLQATTGGQCFSLHATWDVTLTPRRA